MNLSFSLNNSVSEKQVLFVSLGIVFSCVFFLKQMAECKRGLRRAAHREKTRRSLYDRILPLWMNCVLYAVRCKHETRYSWHYNRWTEWRGDVSEWICVCKGIKRSWMAHWMNSNKPAISMNILFGILHKAARKWKNTHTALTTCRFSWCVSHKQDVSNCWWVICRSGLKLFSGKQSYFHTKRGEKFVCIWVFTRNIIEHRLNGQKHQSRREINRAKQVVDVWKSNKVAATRIKCTLQFLPHNYRLAGQ